MLKTLTTQWGDSALYIGPARYQNFYLLGHYSPTRDRKGEKYRQFVNQWRNEQSNIDNANLNFQASIAELSDKQRTTLVEIVELLLGSKMSIRYTVPTNDMSQKYIDADGHNISFTSTGYRLIASIVTALLDTEYATFLIDEPELGISPQAQGVLADFLYDRNMREKYFPHLKHLIFATHSTVFLDRKDIKNNYMVTKAGDEVDLEQTRACSSLIGSTSSCSATGLRRCIYQAQS